MADNKVKFGLKNVHYAVLTVGEDGAATYDTPVPIPGAVNLSLDAAGDTSTFYADNMAYFVTAANDGYSGTLEMAVFAKMCWERSRMKRTRYWWRTLPLRVRTSLSCSNLRVTKKPHGMCFITALLPGPL